MQFETQPTPAFRTLTVTSPAFAPNGSIPTRYTADGDDIPPPIEWTTPPRATKSMAILVEDRDAAERSFVHWIAVGAAPTSLAAGAIEGVNDYGEQGWHGPDPASGRHRYLFRVFALDVVLDRPMTRHELLAAMKGHIVAQGELVGTYERRHKAS